MLPILLNTVMGKVKPLTLKKLYGIYEVTESYTKDGLWKGYTVATSIATGKQGKLYIPKDGREHYRKKPEEELEI